MKKAILWLVFNRNGQTVLILLAALYVAGLLQKDIPEFR
jgi:hypothetical protein